MVWVLSTLIPSSSFILNNQNVATAIVRRMTTAKDDNDNDEEEGRRRDIGRGRDEGRRGFGTRTSRASEKVKRLLVGWLLNVPATCECISGTDLLRQVLRAATLR